MRYSREDKDNWKLITNLLPKTCSSIKFLQLVSKSPLVQFCDLLNVYPGLDTYINNNIQLLNECTKKNGWISGQTNSMVKNCLVHVLTKMLEYAAPSLSLSTSQKGKKSDAKSVGLSKEVLTQIDNLLLNVPDPTAIASRGEKSGTHHNDKKRKKNRYRVGYDVQPAATRAKRRAPKKATPARPSWAKKDGSGQNSVSFGGFAFQEDDSSDDDDDDDDDDEMEEDVEEEEVEKVNLHVHSAPGRRFAL
jgi:hypothetical protein